MAKFKAEDLANSIKSLQLNVAVGENEATIKLVPENETTPVVSSNDGGSRKVPTFDKDIQNPSGGRRRKTKMARANKKSKKTKKRVRRRKHHV